MFAAYRGIVAIILRISSMTTNGLARNVEMILIGFRNRILYVKLTDGYRIYRRVTLFFGYNRNNILILNTETM